MKLLNLVFVILLLFTSCKTTELVDVKSNQKEITSLSLTGINGATTNFDASTNTYTFTVPFGTSLKSIVLNFTLPIGATCSPVSGSAQDFTNPVNYTVIAEDGSKQIYKVVVTIQSAPKSNEKQIIDFSFKSLNPVVKATIDHANKKITAEVPASADLTKLSPTILISPKATLSPASDIVQNFSNSVSYEVTAEDGSKQKYEVTILKKQNNSTLPYKMVTIYEQSSPLYKFSDTTYYKYDNLNRIIEEKIIRVSLEISSNKITTSNSIINYIYTGERIVELILNRNSPIVFQYSYLSNNLFQVISKEQSFNKELYEVTHNNLKINTIKIKAASDYDFNFKYDDNNIIAIEGKSSKSTDITSINYNNLEIPNNSSKILKNLYWKFLISISIDEESLVPIIPPFSNLVTTMSSVYNYPTIESKEESKISLQHRFDENNRIKEVDYKSNYQSNDKGVVRNSETKAILYFYY